MIVKAKFKTILKTSAMLLLLVGTCLASHPYHVSLTEIEWNPKSKNFEVAMCVWPADLEKAISESTDEAVDFDLLTDEAVDELMCKFLPARFQLLNRDGKAGDVRWVGHQRDKKAIWMFFEVKGDEAPSDWTLKNEVFFEQNDDQVNQHIVKISQHPFSFATTIDGNSVEFKDQVKDQAEGSSKN